MTQGWWIQWTTYYMMTPWMRCLEYQALCLLHFIWEQLQQKTSQQSIQHSRWQLFVSIFFPLSAMCSSHFWSGILFVKRSLIVIESLILWSILFETCCSPKIQSFYEGEGLNFWCTHDSKKVNHLFWRNISWKCIKMLLRKWFYWNMYSMRYLGQLNTVKSRVLTRLV